MEGFERKILYAYSKKNLLLPYPNRVLAKVKVFPVLLIMIQPFMSALHTNIFLAFSNIRVTFTACS